MLRADRLTSLPRATAVEGEDRWWSMPASIVAHGLLAVLLLLAPRPPLPRLPPAEPGITVEIVAPPTLDAAAMKPPAVLSAPAKTRPGTAPASLPPAAADDGMIHPTQLYAEAVLADPRSRKARQALGDMAESEGVIQLCNVEAIQQVHRWKPAYDPDFLVAYAMSGLKLAGLALEANGGAFRSDRRWYNIAYKCKVASDFTRVASFEFRVGEAIPDRLWEDHNLPADDGGDDDDD